ncbi:Uncharacterized protein TCM_039840 [Theobroma cacao]|uniref:Uncharacterized protein n=1 Tax=Theobroma cacao TaxID=3641 RepID=A0A061GQY5_THECC|nr:Uncharacterized protein TCM_039840 [Theobroma cacao]
MNHLNSIPICSKHKTETVSFLSIIKQHNPTLLLLIILLPYISCSNTVFKSFQHQRHKAIPYADVSSIIDSNIRAVFPEEGRAAYEDFLYNPQSAAKNREGHCFVLCVYWFCWCLDDTEVVVH